MKISIITRILLITTIIFLHIIFTLMCITISNFFYDNNLHNLDSVNFTRLSHNSLFNSCTYLNCKTNYGLTIFIDISFTGILFFQSIFFISKSFCYNLFKYFSKANSYFVIYFAKIISYSSITMSAFLFQPLNHIEGFVFNVDDFIREYWRYAIILIGIAMMVLTLPFHFISNDVLGTKTLFALLRGKDIDEPYEMLFNKSVILHICRNPFRGGVLLFTFGLSGKWDLGKIIYYVLFSVNIIIESINEEIYYIQSYRNYSMYYKSIPNRFFGVKKYELNREKIN